MTRPLTPGAYLKARRCDTGLSVEDLAARLATTPRVGVVDRVEWLMLIEADAMPATFSTLVAIAVHVRIDFDVLEILDRINLGSNEVAPKCCAICAASPQFIIPDHLPWHRNDLCPACKLHAPPSAIAALDAEDLVA